MFHRQKSKSHFLCMFVGVNITFLPHHFLGLRGIPRRMCDYPEQFWKLNVVSRFGSLVGLGSLMVFTFIIWETVFSKRRVVTGRNPSNSDEWCRLFSPLPSHASLENRSR